MELRGFFDAEIQTLGQAPLTLPPTPPGEKKYDFTTEAIILGSALVGIPALWALLVWILNRPPKLVRDLDRSTRELREAQAIAIEALSDIQAANALSADLVDPNAKIIAALPDGVSRSLSAARKELNSALREFQRTGCPVIPELPKKKKKKKAVPEEDEDEE